MEFLKKLPHFYYDENIFHSIVLSEWKEYEKYELIKNLFHTLIIGSVILCHSKIFKNYKSDWKQDMYQWLLFSRSVYL